MNLIPLQSTIKTGDEHFFNSENILDFTLLDFWKWNQSNLLENRTRGILAEFLVKKALSIPSENRIEWDDYDLQTQKGNKIEVKSSAFLQSWNQEKLSKISFSLSSAETDYYIFCVLKHTDKKSVNPFNLDQWIFYCLESSIVKKLNQKTINLSRLLTLSPQVLTFNMMKHLDI